MHLKYQDVLEYFRESRMDREVALTLKELQVFEQTYQDMLHLLPQDELVPRKLVSKSKRFVSLDFAWVDDFVRQALSEANRAALGEAEVLSMGKGVLEKMAHEKFVAAKGINITLMKYALELLDKEDKRARKQKEKQEAKLKKPSLLRDSTQTMLIQSLLFLVLLAVWVSFRGDFYAYLFPVARKH